MIKSKNPRIDLEALRARVAQEMDATDTETMMRGSKLAIELHLQAIEQTLQSAEERAAPRSTWPDNLKLFPFTISPRLRKMALKLLALALRDQQEVNAALIASQRETIELIRAMLPHLRDEE